MKKGIEDWKVKSKARAKAKATSKGSLHSLQVQHIFPNDYHYRGEEAAVQRHISFTTHSWHSAAEQRVI